MCNSSSSDFWRKGEMVSFDFIFVLTDVSNSASCVQDKITSPWRVLIACEKSNQMNIVRAKGVNKIFNIVPREAAHWRLTTRNNFVAGSFTLLALG